MSPEERDEQGIKMNSFVELCPSQSAKSSDAPPVNPRQGRMENELAPDSAVSHHSAGPFGVRPRGCNTSAPEWFLGSSKSDVGVKGGEHVLFRLAV